MKALLKVECVNKKQIYLGGTKMKKQYLYFMLVCAFVLLLTACSDSSSEDTNDSQETYTLKLADFFPATHEAGSQITQGWADKVEEATDGAVEVEVYPGESLLDDDDIYEGVNNGVADVGHTAIGYNLGRFPLLGALSVGGISYKNSKVSSYVAQDIFDEYSPDEMEDTKVMFLYGLGPGDIVTQNPVKDLSDLKGMEIRVSGEQVDTFDLLGATPVEMGMSDSYESLQKGVIQGIVTPVEALEGWKLAEQTESITEVDFVYNAVHYITMNRDVWESLPEDIQEDIEEVNREIFEDVASTLWDDINESAMEYTQEEFGHETIELSDEEKEKWLERLEPLKEDYINKMDEEGLSGQEIMDQIEELADKYNEEF